MPAAGPLFPNIFLRSPTSSSGTSCAAKCPPFVCSDSHMTFGALSHLMVLMNIALIHNFDDDQLTSEAGSLILWGNRNNQQER